MKKFIITLFSLIGLASAQIDVSTFTGNYKAKGLDSNYDVSVEVSGLYFVINNHNVSDVFFCNQDDQDQQEEGAISCRLYAADASSPCLEEKLLLLKSGSFVRINQCSGRNTFYIKDR